MTIMQKGSKWVDADDDEITRKKCIQNGVTFRQKANNCLLATALQASFAEERTNQNYTKFFQFCLIKNYEIQPLEF